MDNPMTHATLGTSHRTKPKQNQNIAQDYYSRMCHGCPQYKGDTQRLS